MLEELLLQLQSDQLEVPDTNAFHYSVSGFVSAVPDMPDWASRARKHVAAKKRARSVQPRTGDDSHEMLEMTLCNLEKSAHLEQLSLPHEDDDLLIHGLRDGWGAVVQSRALDTVWRFLRMFDLYLYKPSGMSAISRLAALRALRAMLVHRVSPLNQAVRPVPKFFEPTRLQQTERHSTLIDYFAWPAVRDHLIRHSRDIRSIPRIAQTKFAKAFVFDWPYELSDAFMTIKASGRLVFSEDFNRRWHDLHYWTITAFDDTSFIPAHLQFDRKQLTQSVEVVSAAERKRIAEGVRSTRQFMGQNLELLENEGNQTEKRAACRATSPGRAAENSHEMITHPAESSKALDEWSWFFASAEETHGTIKSLLEMPIPA